LQKAMQALDRSPPSICQGEFCIDKGQELSALEVVEVGDAVESQPLGRGEDRQPFGAACTRLSVVSQSVSSGAWQVSTFPITIVFGNVVHRTPRLRLHNQREAIRTPIIILGKVA
jgi:hypothetical protein